MDTYLALRTLDDGTAAELSGAWTVFSLPEILPLLAPLASVHGGLCFDGAHLTALDTAAAAVLEDHSRRLRARGATVRYEGFAPAHARLLARISALPHEAPSPPATPAATPLSAFFVACGRTADAVAADAARGLGLLGEFLDTLAALARGRARVPFTSIVFHLNEIGVKALPIIALMAFAVAFVTGYQGAFQLQKFDAVIYTVDLITLSTLREMGVLITAIMVAGRSGSAFAAQLGTMKLNEEVDALCTMGLSPFRVLVAPRLIAIVLALPLLTLVADFAGLFGGYLFSVASLELSPLQFMSRMHEAADVRHFYVGLSKAPVFAVLIGIVGCLQGLRVRGSAEDVGRKTVTAVVQSIFLVIVADALFSVIFTRLGV